MTKTAEPVIVLVCTDCDNTRIVYHGISKHIPVSAVITESQVSRKQLIRRRVRKLGLWTTMGQLVFQAGVSPFIRKFSRRRIKAILENNDLSLAPMPDPITRHVESVNSEDFLNYTRELKPDLIVVNGTRIISRQMLDQINCPIINVHVGITPLYRGVHGAYWALTQNDRANCGVTVHFIDPGIDTGGILKQATIEPGPADNFITYPYLQISKAVEILREVIPDVLRGQSRVQQAPSGKSRLWYHPTVWQYIKYRIKGVK